MYPARVVLAPVGPIPKKHVPAPHGKLGLISFTHVFPQCRPRPHAACGGASSRQLHAWQPTSRAALRAEPESAVDSPLLALAHRRTSRARCTGTADRAVRRGRWQCHTGACVR